MYASFSQPLSNFASVSGLQVFSPSATNTSGEGSVPLEVLIDLRAENNAFDRLVPQTDAPFQYDKFNRLRLHNETTSIARTSEEKDRHHEHLHNQTVGTEYNTFDRSQC